MTKFRRLSPPCCYWLLVVGLYVYPVAAQTDSPNEPAVTKLPGISPSDSTTRNAAVNEPLVARIEMRLSLGDKVVDVIEKGDLLTVVSEREDSYVIRTFNGHRGAVDKANAVRLAESIEIYNELIQADAKQGRFHTLRASAWWALGEHEKAMSDFNQAIELGYREANAFASRGIFQAATGHHAQAVEDFTAALDKDPKDTSSLINRAAARMALGQAEKAVEDYTAAIGLDATNSILLQQRAIAQKAAGKLNEALADFDSAIELEPKDIGAWMGRGFIYFQQGKHPQAIENFSHVIQLAPQTAVAYNNRGYNYQQLGKWKEALADFDKAIELAPKYGLAWQNKAWLLVLSGDESLRDARAAVTAAEAACELTAYGSVNDLLAISAALAANGQFEKAIGWQEKVVELLPDEDKAFAKKILERYQRNEPFDPQILAEQNQGKDEKPVDSQIKPE
jgi:tetratricopeptide (TPR) repeat protein